MTSSSWPGCLDAFGLHLDEQRRALAEGRPSDIRAFTPPAALSPLPASLRPRAQRLLAESVALTEEIEQAARQVAAQLRLVAALESGGASVGPSSSYIDTHS